MKFVRITLYISKKLGDLIDFAENWRQEPVFYWGIGLIYSTDQLQKCPVFWISLIFVFLPAFGAQRVQNCVLAAAFGDALGRVTEFIPTTAHIFEKYPHGVKTFSDFLDSDWGQLPGVFSATKIAPYTDDTAMALLVLDALIEAVKNNYDLDQTMSLLAHTFVMDMDNPLGWNASFRAPGNCCITYVKKLAQKMPQNNHVRGWWKVGPANGRTGGCGSVMRAYPFGLVFANDIAKAKTWAAEHSFLMHGDPAARAACAAMAVGVAYAMQNKEQDFIIDQMILAAREYDQTTGEKMAFAWQSAKKAKNLLKPGENVFEQLRQPDSLFRKQHDLFFNRFLGWSAQDAIAGAVYLFALSGSDIKTAIYLGVHTPGDSDSIATLAGALVGAYSHERFYSDTALQSMENYEHICKLAQRVGELGLQKKPSETKGNQC